MLTKTKTVSTMNIYNVIILDESGSMSAIYDQALTGINEVLSGIRKTQEEFPGQQHYVTIVTFEGSGIAGVKTRRERVAIGQVEDMGRRDYRPGGCTPLYDAIGKTLNEMEGVVKADDRVMVTVITDGEENASQEYAGRTVKEMIARLREKGWTFAYIGANQDAVEVARDLHIDNALNFDATPEGTVLMSVRFRKASRRYACLCSEGEAYGSVTELFDQEEN